MPGKRITDIPSTQFVGPGRPWHHAATDWGVYPSTFVAVEALPCAPPTMEEMRARFPEFANIPDAQVQIAIDDASCWADASWLSNGCPNCTTAIAFLAAHYLAMGLFAADALPETLPPSEPGGPVIVAGGQVTSLRFESMGVSFSAPQIGGGGGGAGGTGVGDRFDWGATPYGQRYIELLKVNKPAVLVV
jgi:hypothetical protein